MNPHAALQHSTNTSSSDDRHQVSFTPIRIRTMP
jgi:hypothetical protein